jgi:hypothetical protein
MVCGIADNAFKGIWTLDKLLEKTPPKGRESWTLEWTERARRLPVFCMVAASGPHPSRALTFSSLRNYYTSLAKRAYFRDTLRIHGVRAGTANAIDRKLTYSLKQTSLGRC